MENLLGRMSLMTILIVVAAIVGLTLINVVVLSLKRKLNERIIVLAVIQVVIYLVLSKIFIYNATLHLITVLPSIVLTLLFQLLTEGINIKTNRKLDKNWSVRIPVKNKADLIIQNIRRGMVIFGSAGSGKTESLFVPIIKHAANNDMPCLCYDYKNGELTEIAHFFYEGKNIKKAVIIPHEPLYSDRVNCFSPKYLKDEHQLRQMTKTIFANLKKAEGETKSSTSFFDKIPESTLAAVIWSLRKHYPDKCTLPHAVAFCLVKHPNEIAMFIKKDDYARAVGAPLIDSLTSENQVAGVKASLSLPLTDLALPAIFWVMGGDDVDLDINNPENPTFLSVVNDPQLEKTNAPFISLIVSTVINQMQVRNRPASMLLFDEGTTFTIDNISRIPATMRSYNIATVFSTQDKALAKENYGDTITNSLLANLSYQVIGKTNDPESVKYYKQISEEIEKKTLSKSFKDGILNTDTRLSEGTRETSKYKNQDFTRLQPGEFFVFADGKEQKYTFTQINYQRVIKKIKYHVTPAQIQQNYNRIFEEVDQM